MDRREFAGLLPGLLAAAAVLPERVEAQSGALPTIESGVFKPSPWKAGSQEARVCSTASGSDTGSATCSRSAGSGIS